MTGCPGMWDANERIGMARSLVYLSAWESLPADVRGTNGTSPPMPAGIRLRGEVPPIFLRLRRRPGTSDEKRLGRDGV